MRRVVVLIACILAPLLPPQVSAAAEGAAGPILSRIEVRAELLTALREAPDEATGRAAENAVWGFWMTAPDRRAQALLDQALERRRWYDFAGALPSLDRLIALYPDYAEGWNQRATVRFLREEYQLSLADIEETLAREPAHFGALAGKAVILMRQGKTALGQLALIEALAVHPWLRERTMLLDAGSEDL